MVNVTVFKSPDVFAEFGRISVFGVSECCSVVSVSSLKSFSVSPMYVLEVLLSLRLTDEWRQFLLSGHVFFSRQLHVLLSVVLSALSLTCSDKLKCSS